MRHHRETLIFFLGVLLAMVCLSGCPLRDDALCGDAEGSEWESQVVFGFSSVADLETAPDDRLYAVVAEVQPAPEGLGNMTIALSRRNLSGWESLDEWEDGDAEQPTQAMVGLSTGRIHLMSGASRTYRWSSDASIAWQPSETLAAPDWNDLVDLAVDPQGRVAALYGSTWVASRQPGTDWDWDRIDALTDGAGIPGIAAGSWDADGNLHICYITSFSVRYANREASNWVVEDVETSEQPGRFTVCSLGVAPDGSARVGYGVRVPGTTSTPDETFIRVASNVTDTWVAETVWENVGPMPNSADWLAVDSEGTTHVVLVSDEACTLGIPCTAYRLVHGEDDGGTWVFDLVDERTVAHMGARIALDSAGNPHIGFEGWADGAYHVVVADRVVPACDGE